MNSVENKNMRFMSVTEDTSQSPMGWLNLGAAWNMRFMSVTEDTSQSPMGWLKEGFPWNM